MTNTKHAVLTILLCLLTGFFCGVHGQELRIAFSYDIPPFITDNGTKGMEIEIVQKAMEYRGHSFAVLQAPYKRLQVAVSEMAIDGSAAVRKSTDDGTYYSQNFIDFKNFAITKKNAGLTLDTLSDLKEKSILAWQNAHIDLGSEFEKLFSPSVKEEYMMKYHEIPIQINQVDMFLRGRAEVIIIDESIFKWVTRQLAPHLDLEDAFVYHDIFPEKISFQVNFKEKNVRDDFNAGLQHIRENGTYQAIFDKYFQNTTF